MLENRYSFSLTGPRAEFVARIESGSYGDWLATLEPRLRWIAEKRYAQHLKWLRWKAQRQNADHDR